MGVGKLGHLKTRHYHIGEGQRVAFKKMPNITGSQLKKLSQLCGKVPDIAGSRKPFPGSIFPA